MNAIMTPIDNIRPYENNPRDNSKSIAQVAESIRNYGFLQPIVCDADGVILAGHTRYAAARSLGMCTVPVLFASELTPAQARAYRLADNKVGEASKWLEDMLTAELEAVSLEDSRFSPEMFGFDTSVEKRRYKSWENAGKKCNLEKKIGIRSKGGFLYTSFFVTGKKGRSLEEIKADKSIVPIFADNLCDYLEKTFGTALSASDWCICTTPRRRHKEGFHFATEICVAASKQMGLPFYADIVVSHNRDRIHTDFELVHIPNEKNIILYDDILTTGTTMRDTRALLIEAGHVVFPVAAIRNQ